MAQPRASKAYWREISAVLLLKAMAIAILYGVFFASTNTQPVSPDVIAKHLELSGGAP